MKTALSSKVYLIFFCAIIILASLGYFYLTSIGNLINSSDRIKSIYDRIYNVERILYLTKDLETSVRGYLISGNKVFVADYPSSRSALFSEIETFTQTFIPSSTEQDEYNRLKLLIKEKIVYQDQLLVLLNSDQKDQAERLISEGKERIITEKIEAESQQLLKSQRAKLSNLIDIEYFRSQKAFVIIIAGKLITLGLFFAGIIKILSELKTRLHLERELQEKNHQLSTSNQELEIKNKQLTTANETIRLYSESTIKKQELLFKTVVNNIPSPIIIFNLEADIEFINEASLKVFRDYGFDPRALPTKDILKNRHPSFYAAFEKIKAGIEMLETEMSFPTTAGDVSTLIVRMLPIIENDQVVKVLVISFDITSRKKYEDKLVSLNKELDEKVKERTIQLEALNHQLEENSREMFDLYENAPLGYYSLNASGIVVRINTTCLNLLGYSKEDVEGKDFKELILPEKLRKTFDETTHQMKQGKKTENYEIEFVKKDKSLLPVLLTLSPIHNEAGEFVMSRCAFSDNTEVVKARTEIEKYIEALQIANKDLEAFSYSISHDLRAPLRSVNGFGQILKKDYYSQLDEEGRRFLDIIILNSSQMGTMIDSLLEFSKLGRKGMTKSIFNVGELIEEVIKQLLHIEKNLPENIFTIEKMPVIYADKNLLKQVWTNLIMNSVKFTSKRTDPRIWIRCEEDLNFYTFTIKDNGAGFDPRYASKLFGVFQRLHSNEEFEGTGAGLAIVKRIVNSHGGEIWADSELEKGASFYFSIPKQIQ
jgi:PAS domain S-box-containing protein